MDDYYFNYPCDFGAAHKYWQFRIYACFDATRVSVNLKTLRPLTKNYQYSMFESIVPKMSADEQEPFVVSVSSATSGNAYNMYDRVNSTYCQGQLSEGQWTTTIDMGSPVIIKGVQIRSGATSWNQAPTTFKVQGKVSGGSWTDIAYYTLGIDYWSSRENHLGSFELDNDTAYQYYRLLVLSTPQASYVMITELGWTTELRTNPINYYTEEYLVPVMSSNSQSGYVASAKSYYNNEHAPWRAFDRSTNSNTDVWASANTDKTDGSGNCDVWLQIEMPTAKVANRINLVAQPGDTLKLRAPKNFKLQGRNNGSDWTDIFTASETSSYTDKTWEFSNTTAYSYYRLYITKTFANDDNVSVSQLNLSLYQKYN